MQAETSVRGRVLGIQYYCSSRTAARQGSYCVQVNSVLSGLSPFKKSIERCEVVDPTLRV